MAWRCFCITSGNSITKNDFKFILIIRNNTVLIIVLRTINELIEKKIVLRDSTISIVPAPNMILL